MYARIGRTYCVKCESEVKKDTVDEIADAVLALDPETRLQIVFPLQPTLAAAEDVQAQETSKQSPRKRKSRKKAGAPGSALTEQLRLRLFDLRKAGFNRLYQAGQVSEFSTPESLLDIDFEQPV